MDVVTAAWNAAGSPRSPATAAMSGVCARCATQASALTHLRAVVSPSFTAYDSWHAPARDGLCPPCAWSYTHRELRTRAHHVQADGQLTPLTAAQVLSRLQSGPVTIGEAYTVPLRPGRKHLLPETRWASIRIDNATLSWTDADAGRLSTVGDLVGRGFKPTQLAAAAPPWRQLQPLSRTATLEVIDLWHQLDVWRDSPPWLALSTHIASQAARNA